ncbi:alpha-2 adrenergic receptor-like [Schistocerca cancellata]|uniref:alpha-2 adrenergic receptor-like n=1 Tax=Schistocerca cancellata TaxID=274614 RepID=UPI0021185386|nr:alpha-2 adrenergic receptor-like [Schistocerca cancellata]
MDEARATAGNSSSQEDDDPLGGYYLLWNLSALALSSPEADNSTNTTANSTLFIVDSLFPSGYSLPHIILASIVVTVLMIIVVVGNMLVIIAIATEKALKNIQNWFIASLAVADFFLGLIIMPFSLANEIMGYWIFGNWWCDVHSAMDVLLCTASIMNLCLISLDRYWSITQAVDYLKKRTPVRAAIMIALVWLLSGLVCIPPLLGWKVDRPVEEFPKCQRLNQHRGLGAQSPVRRARAVRRQPRAKSGARRRPWKLANPRCRTPSPGHLFLLRLPAAFTNAYT